MNEWFIKHTQGMCFNLGSASAFQIDGDKCNIFYNGDMMHPTFTILKNEYPEKFAELETQYNELSQKAPPKHT